MAACSPLLNSGCAAQANPDLLPVQSIYWSDGDSGRIDGKPFRLNDIDAPETGGVGAAIGGAKCELERELGFQSKAWAVQITRENPVYIIKTHGEDRYGRLIIDLSVNGQDMGAIGIESGMYQSWKHDGKKTLEPRPKWCTEK